jgi:hypothetical protein
MTVSLKEVPDLYGALQSLETFFEMAIKKSEYIDNLVTKVPVNFRHVDTHAAREKNDA